MNASSRLEWREFQFILLFIHTTTTFASRFHIFYCERKSVYLNQSENKNKNMDSSFSREQSAFSTSSSVSKALCSCWSRVCFLYIFFFSIFIRWFSIFSFFMFYFTTLKLCENLWNFLKLCETFVWKFHWNFKLFL